MCRPISSELKIKLQQLWNEDNENSKSEMVDFPANKKGMGDDRSGEKISVCCSSSERKATPN